MNNFQDTMFFPFRDRHSWNQFLIACLIMLAAFIIPILPVVRLSGYAMKIMRQVILQKEAPSMPAWQGSDWSEMFMDGLRLYGAQLVLMLPLIVLFGVGIVAAASGSIFFSAVSKESSRSLAPVGGGFLFLGMAIILLASLLSVPYGVIASVAQAHVAAKRSFPAAFAFREWWQIFRRGWGQFVVAFAMILVASLIFGFAIQVAMITIVLICIVPLLTIPYSVYLMLITYTLYAQAHVKGQEALQTV